VIKARLLTLFATATAAAVAATAASALTVPAGLVYKAGLPFAPICVTNQRMAQLDGGDPDPSGFTTTGLTDFGSRQVWLLNWICTGLDNWAAKRPITKKQAYSLMTLYHEAAHTRGIRSERTAECDGVNGALATIEARPTDKWALSQLRRFFLTELDKHRPAAYQLRGTCFVPGVPTAPRQPSPTTTAPPTHLPPVNLPPVNLPPVNLPPVNLPPVNIPATSVGGVHIPAQHIPAQHIPASG
jgi:hypothetical protein